MEIENMQNTNDFVDNHKDGDEYAQHSEISLETEIFEMHFVKSNEN